MDYIFSVKISEIYFYFIIIKNGLHIFGEIQRNSFKPQFLPKKHIRKRVEKNISGKDKNLHAKNVQKK